MGDGINRDDKQRDVTTESSDPSAMGYQKLRSPRHHGDTLQVPSLRDVDQVWKSNLDQARLHSRDETIVELRRLGRQEIVELAVKYSKSYLKIDLSGRSTDQILLAGHQPELFHAGVWYKNFVLSELGQRFNCLPINLIVDNDICGNASIRFPSVNQNQVSIGTIPIVRPGPNVPYESKAIEDWDFFQQFQNRVTQAIGGRIESPIINRLWPHVIESANRLSSGKQARLGQAIAAGRHRLENEIGLRTLEVPVSWISGSQSFAGFVKTILTDLERFQNDYNQSLLDYRKVHRIRSRSHPVPELESVDGWSESPFWVWQIDEAVRRRLFSRVSGHSIWLSDLAGWEAEFESATFTDDFVSLGSKGIAIRPKALMTTMFSRLVLSDLFLHGIGGAKYDQLTNVIANRFFSVRLPEFLTLSATMKLPTQEELVTRSDLVTIDRSLREFKYHPEKNLNNPSESVRELIRQKQNWTQGDHRVERSREKHLAIEALNAQLSQFSDIDPTALEAKRVSLAKKIRASEILDSREYSFCLFPDSLIEQLKTLARV